MAGRRLTDTPPVPGDHESPLGTPVDDKLPDAWDPPMIWHSGQPVHGPRPPDREYPPVVNPPTHRGPPRNTILPVVLGTPRVGSAVTSTSGTWDNDPTSFIYFGLRNGVSIGPGGETPVYTLQPEDEGSMVACRVWAMNDEGRGEATSFPIGPVLPAPDVPDPPPVNTGRPVVSGTPQIGHSLSATPGTWTNNPANYAYQWLHLPFERSAMADIPGATNPTYLLVDSDVGQRMACRVTASNSSGSDESTSLPVGPVAGPDWNPPAWLIRDNAIHEFDPDRPKPLYQVPTPDPVFHSIVTRITGNPGTAMPNGAGFWGTVSRHQGYSVQAWNCDQSLIYLSENSGTGAQGSGGVFLRGDLPYEPLFDRPDTWPSGADVRWHPTDPDLMDCAAGNVYSLINVRTGDLQEVLNLGAGYTSMSIGQALGNRSTDGKVIGLTATFGGVRRFIAYDIETDTRHPDVLASSVSPTSFTSARVTPDGQGILWNFTGDNFIHTDLAGNVVHQFVPAQQALGDVALDANHEDIFVGRVNSGSVGAGPGGTQSAWRLRDGQRTQLTFNGYVYFASTRAQDVNYSGHARWAAGDTRANRSGDNLSNPPYTCENLLLPLDGSTPYRLCHNYNTTVQDNTTFTQVSLSPDGQRAIFASSWLAEGTTPRPLQAYVVDYRSPTMPPKPSPPVNTVPPSITGTPTVGEQLTVSNGTWTGGPVSYARRWRRGGDPIPGATLSAYELQETDVGLMIDCQVIAISNTTGGYATALADAVGPITDPSASGWEPPSWVIYDRTVRDYNPARPKIGYLQPTPDPNYSGLVTRVSDEPGATITGIGGTWGQVCGPNYINHAAWNLDQTLLYILNIGGTSGSIWLDGETYQPRFARGGGWPSGADVRWHMTDPSLMNFAAGSRFGTYNPATGTAQTVRDFGGTYSDMRIGHNKGNVSLDGKRVVLTAVRAGNQTVIVYDIENDQVLAELDPLVVAPGRSLSSCWSSPSGTYIIWNFSPDNYLITDLEGNAVFDFPTNYISHGDCCFDEVGDEVLAGRRNASSLPGWTPNSPSGEIWKHRLRDGHRTRLTEGGWCPHTATRGQDPLNSLYCVAGTYDNRTGGTPQHPPYVGEIIMPRLDGSRVYRLCQHMGNNGPEYETFCFAVQSPDSGRVVFRSDWRAPGATPRPVQAYVVDIRV